MTVGLCADAEIPLLDQDCGGELDADPNSINKV